MRTYVLGTEDSEEWRAVLERCGGYDVYHLPEYHRLAEEQEGARAALCVCEAGRTVLAMPLLLREVSEVPGLGRPDLRDATSVYGYPGPLCSVQHPPQQVLRSFVAALRRLLEQEKVIAAFSRLHPFLENQETILDSLGGDVLEIGPTVAIDLEQPVEAQWRQYRSNHRRDIGKARREGVICVHDDTWTYLDSFIRIYHDTMRRADASDTYLFDPTYFSRLRELLGTHIHLFAALRDGQVLSAALFTLCNSIIQYHLGGTDSRYLALAPSKLVFDTVRLWGNEIGARVLHLGGGVGGGQDSLYRFKAGFSRARFQYKVWQMVVDQAAYAQCLRQRAAWNRAQGLETVADDYFPAYRCPTRAAG